MLEKNIARFILPKDLKLLEIKRISRGYLWIVKKLRQSFEICPKCATPSNIRAGRCSSRVREQGLRDEILYLEIHKHRYFCKTCKKTFTEPVSIVWPRKRSTNRFRKALAKACHNYTNLSRVKQDYRVSTGFMYSTYYEQLEVKLREQISAPWPTHLGIDEHFFTRKSGYREFVTVLTDIRGKKMFEVALGKSNKKLIEQLKHIPGRDRVKVVAIDMSSGYRALVGKLFPNAQIVSDKFHVLRLLTPAIMKEGKNIHGHRQELKTRKLLLHSRIKLDYWLRCDIDRYLKDKPVLKETYYYKEKLFELYRTKGFNKAKKKLDLLLEAMKRSELVSIKKLRRTLSKWKNEVLEYFKQRWTNAFTEAMNNTGKLVQKRAYGYKSFKNYRLRLLSACIF